MKGIILLPEIYCGGYLSIDTYKPLLNLIQKEYNFDLLICNDIDIKKLKTYDVVFTLKSPQKVEPMLMSNLVNLSKSIKLITYFTDIHEVLNPNTENHEEINKEYHYRMHKMMDRADRIIYAYDEKFREKWGEYIEKALWLPQFVGYSDYANSLPFNETPVLRCLASGASGYYYPFRTYIMNNFKEYCHILKHPGYEKNIEEIKSGGFKVAEDFLNVLHQFICGLSTVSIIKYVLMKHFEIPAVGSLLLSNWCTDLDKLGFKSGVNYIRIDVNNFRDVVKTIIEYPKNFESIRRNGRDFVLKNHTVYNRLPIIKKAIEE